MLREGRGSTLEWSFEFLLLPEMVILKFELSTLGTKSEQRMIRSLLVTEIHETCPRFRGVDGRKLLEEKD